MQATTSSIPAARQEAIAAATALALLCGLLTAGFMSIHMVAVLVSAGAGWDFRLYSLELLGFLFVFHGVGLAAACRRLLAGDGEALRPARLACGWILGLAVPLVPIQAGAVVPAAAALVGIAALTACYSRI